MATDGVRELSQVQSMMKMLLEFTDDSFGAAAQIFKSYKADPAKRELAKLINLGETKSLVVSSERAGRVAKAFEEGGVQFEKFNHPLGGGLNGTEFVFKAEDEKAVRDMIRNGTIRDVLDYYDNREGGQVSKKDMLEETKGNYGSIGPLNEAEAFLVEHYSKKMNVPITMDTSIDGTSRVFFAGGDAARMDRISREVEKDLNGEGGEVVRKQVEWESHNDAKMLNRIINDYDDPENGKRMPKGTIIVSENGYRIDVRRRDYLITRPNGTTVALSRNPRKLERISTEDGGVRDGQAVRTQKILEGEIGGMKRMAILSPEGAARYDRGGEIEKRQIVENAQRESGRPEITDYDREAIRRNLERRELIEAKLAVDARPKVAVMTDPYCVDEGYAEFTHRDIANVEAMKTLTDKEKEALTKIRSGTITEADLDMVIPDSEIENFDRHEQDFTNRTLGDVGVFQMDERDYEPDHAFEDEDLDIGFYDEQYGHDDVEVPDFDEHER